MRRNAIIHVYSYQLKTADIDERYFPLEIYKKKTCVCYMVSSSVGNRILKCTKFSEHYGKLCPCLWKMFTSFESAKNRKKVLAQRSRELVHALEQVTQFWIGRAFKTTKSKAFFASRNLAALRCCWANFVAFEAELFDWFSPGDWEPSTGSHSWKRTLERLKILSFFTKQFLFS